MDRERQTFLLEVVTITSLFLICAPFAFCGESQPEAWDEWIQNQVGNTESSIVQNRQVVKESKIQLMVSPLGFSNRNDLYNNYTLSFSGKYYFSEMHGWEFLRLYIGFPTPTEINREVIQKASYTPDVQLSKFQLVSSYVISPIYGKYAWNDKQVFYFDIFGTAGAGIRFAKDIQPVFELGLGMSHYLFQKRLGLVPEYRIRLYSEQRTSSVLVFESLTQIGVSWLF